MTTKSYFSQSVHDAMQKARFELGPEALLLSSKKVTQPNPAGAYEVICGIASEIYSEPLAYSATEAQVAPPVG